jgi:hypothetical protein
MHQLVFICATAEDDDREVEESAEGLRGLGSNNSFPCCRWGGLGSNSSFLRSGQHWIKMCLCIKLVKLDCNGPLTK